MSTGWVAFTLLYLMFVVVVLVGTISELYTHWNQRHTFLSWWPLGALAGILFAPFWVLYVWWKL